MNRSTSILCALFTPCLALGQLTSTTKVTLEPGFTDKTLSAGFTPFAQFRGSAGGSSGSVTGTLFWLEKALPSTNNRLTTIGGWYWFKGSDNVYQIHVKHFFQENFGAQIAALGASGYGKTDFTLMGIYDALITKDPEAKTKFAVQAGAGLYRFADVNKTEPTAYVQGSVFLQSGLSFDVTYWYINTPGGNFTRVAAGIGYRF